MCFRRDVSPCEPRSRADAQVRRPNPGGGAAPTRRSRHALVATAALGLILISGCGGGGLRSESLTTDDYVSIFSTLQETNNGYNQLVQKVDKDVAPDFHYWPVGFFEIVKSGERYHVVASQGRDFDTLDASASIGRDVSIWIRYVGGPAGAYPVDLIARPEAELEAADDACAIRASTWRDLKERDRNSHIHLFASNLLRLRQYVDLMPDLLELSTHESSKDAMRPKCDTLIIVDVAFVSRRAKTLEEETSKRGDTDVLRGANVIIVRVIDVQTERLIARKVILPPPIGLLGPQGYPRFDEAGKYLRSLLTQNGN